MHRGSEAKRSVYDRLPHLRLPADAWQSKPSAGDASDCGTQRECGSQAHHGGGGHADALTPSDELGRRPLAVCAMRCRHVLGQHRVRAAYSAVGVHTRGHKHAHGLRGHATSREESVAARLIRDFQVLTSQMEVLAAGQFAGVCPRPARGSSHSSAAILKASAASMLLRWPAPGSTETGAPPSLADISWCIATGVSVSSLPTTKCVGARMAEISPSVTCSTVAWSDLMYDILCSAAMLLINCCRCSGLALGLTRLRATGSAMSRGSLPASKGARRLSTKA